MPEVVTQVEKKIRATLIHQAFCGPNDPGGTRHYEFARRMVQGGHSFTVVTSDVSYLTGHKVNGEAQESLDGIQVFRSKTYKPKSSNFLRRVVSMCSFAVTSLLAAFGSGKADVIIGTTPPIFQAASACLLAACRRKPFILEVRDLWPAFAIDMGILKNPVLIKLSRWLEHTLYRRAAHMIVNSPAYRDYLIGERVPSNKISLIANGVDPAMFDRDAQGDCIRRKYELTGKFVVTYAGALGVANDIDTILRAAKRLQRFRSIHFMLVGDGKERERLQDKAKTMSLQNVTFTGAQPKGEMSEFLAATNACVATLQDIPMFRTTYPNKVFDYMAAGKPVVLGIDGVIREVVENANGGVFVKPGDDEQLADAILKLYRDPDSCHSMGINARHYVRRHFNRSDQARDFVELMQKIANGKSDEN